MPIRYTAKELAKLLEKNGWELDRIKGSHYIYKNPATNQTTIIPFHNKEIPPGTANAILRQAGLK